MGVVVVIFSVASVTVVIDSSVVVASFRSLSAADRVVVCAGF